MGLDLETCIEQKALLLQACRAFEPVAKAHGTTCRQGMGFCGNELCEAIDGCGAEASRILLNALQKCK